jgi:hypothetical protein
MKRLPIYFLLLQIVTIWWFPSALISAESDKYPQRMALAISGGASKGAYEAGFNWGALKILRNFAGQDPVLGGEFRPFEAASIAGASAGGINSLLSGLTWCTRSETDGGLANSINDNIFRDVWLNIDANRLLPSTATSEYYESDDALFSRNDLRIASKLLREKWHIPAFRDECQVPLGVTVTRVKPEVLYIGDVKVQNQRFYIPFELYVKQDRTAGFRFNPVDYPALTDASKLTLPTQAGLEPNTLSDQQIETISFASSAFPVAFSRQRLAYCRLSDIQVAQSEEKKNVPLPEKSKRALQCPQGYELIEAEFADGGLFDNLPIGLARILAEQRRDSTKNPIPITYLYIDPERLRYEVPESKTRRDCDKPKSPAACRQMEYSFLSESGLLVGALGSARKYELYRELTSDYWTNNLSQLGYLLADKLKETRPDYHCDRYLPYFERKLKCDEAIRRAGLFLEIAYDRIDTPIISPFSVKRLRQENIARDCGKSNTKLQVEAQCRIDFLRYRDTYANALTGIMHEANITDKELFRRIHNSRLSSHSDRIIRVSSVGSPITGDLLGDFGGFLDYKFREYDYYAGVYDVIVAAANLVCTNHFSPTDQGKVFADCFNAVGQRAYETLGLDNDKKGKYIFALLAQDEFGKKNTFKFAYDANPIIDKDMQIIHEGLRKTLEAGLIYPDEEKTAFFIEKAFFEHLKQQGFEPTPIDSKQQPLLMQIMDDPDTWSYELISRISNRLVYLEQQAENIFIARESNPENRDHAYPGIMGAGSYVLRTVNYKYPTFTFAPSTAPTAWIWRNIIPYEFGFDLAEGDLLISWQPTWSLTKKDKLGVRGTFGFAGGLLNSAEVAANRDNYFSLGLDYTRLTRYGIFSSWGVAPYWYHMFNDPEIGEQDTFGADIHVGMLENRLRIGLGARDFDDMGDTWFLTVGVTDIPGMVYWLTR